jgi:biopolymer transport protein ExbD/biopolymer transport protein TolR
MAISSQDSQGRGTLFTEINITPLTDIFLVLLIIMMVIAPMFQNARQDITVPKLHQGESISENPAMVELTKEGHMYINGTPVTAPGLMAGLQEILTQSPDKILTLRADQAVRNSHVMKVYEAASKAGFVKLVVSGESLSASRQQTLKDQPQEAHPSGGAI